MSVCKLAVVAWACCLLCVSPAWAENEGLGDLDKATALKLSATKLDDLAEVIKHAEAALEKGLDEENTLFAKQLLAAAHYERGATLAQAILGEGEPDPRWPQLRKLALPELEKAVELLPNQAQAHLMIARLQTLPGGDRARAREALDAALASKDVPTDVLTKVYLLRAGLQQDEAKRLADLESAIKLSPKDPEILRARGLYLLTSEKVAEAIADLRKATELDGQHAATFEALGMALLIDQKIDESLAAFDRAIKLDPDLTTAYANRARVYVLKEQLHKAIADLDKALEQKPGALQVLLLRARVHAQAEQLPEALEDVDRALKIVPGSLPALRLRAELLAGSGKIGEAIEGLEKLTQALPTNSELLLQLGTYYLADKQPQRAIEIFNSILEADPANWLALRSRADALLSVGKHAAAIADYEATLKINPKHPGVLNNLAWVLSTSPEDQVRNGKRAIKLATQAAELTEFKQAYILSTLAAAYAETGNFEKAREWSQKAVALDDGEQKEQLTKELESYQANKPWRELQTAEQEKASGDQPAEQQAKQPAPARTADF